jgi:hypothetical protein
VNLFVKESKCTEPGRVRLLARLLSDFLGFLCSFPSA